MSKTANPAVLRAVLPWLIALALLIALPFLFPGRTAITLLNQMGITIVLALSYNILLGQGGMLSFGHAIYAGLGGYAAVHLLSRIADGGLLVPLPLLPLAAGLFALALSALVGLFSLRRAGTSFAMISLGVGELVAASALIFVAFSGGEDGISADRTDAGVLGLTFGPPTQVYWIVAGWTWVAALAMFLFTLTPAGNLARAVRDNDLRVAHMGFNPAAIRYRTFCASGFFAGIAGGLFAITYEFAGPETLNLAASGQILLATYLGGIGVFWGPVVGAIVFTVLQSVISFHTGLWQLYLGLAFVLSVLFCPAGLAGVLGNLRVPSLRQPKILAVGCGKAIALACALFGAIGLVEWWYYQQQSALLGGEFRFFGLTEDQGLPPLWLCFALCLLVGGVLAWVLSKAPNPRTGRQ